MRRFLIVIILLLMAINSFAQPTTISYQGILTDDEGNPLNGNKSLSFSIFLQETGGTSIWTESHLFVNVDEGLFNVELGSATSFGTIDFSQELWLEISVDGTTLTPRIPFNASSYSMVGKTSLNLAGGATGSLPYQTAAGETSMLNAGTAGQILTMNGSGTAPVWANGLSTTLSGGYLYVGNSTDEAQAREITGDVTINNTGVTAIGTSKVTSNMLAGSISDTKLSTISTSGKVSNSATSATTLNTANTIVLRDATGNFTAGTITADLTGTADKADDLTGGAAGSLPYQTAAGETSMLNAGTAGQILTMNGGGNAPVWANGLSTTLSGGYLYVGNSNDEAQAREITGDVSINNTGVTAIGTSKVTNNMLAGSISDTKLSTISTSGKVSNSATSATTLNTANTIVLRDASGNFTAGTITADLTGTADKSNDLTGGAAGSIPFQTGDGATSMLSVGTEGQVLSLVNGFPQWADAYSGLTNFTESNFTYDAKTGVKFTPNNAETNVDLVIQPKGSGSILAHQPDGTSNGGNNRGIGAIDLQLTRGTSEQVASGSFSVISGGYWNEASKNHTVVGGGSNNTASGSYSCIPGGKSNIASGSASVSFGSNNEANGTFSTVSGYYNTADGENNFVAGSRNIANDYMETIFGRYATVASGSTSSWNGGERLFSIGNGTGPSSDLRSNALTIYKNANTLIGGTLTLNTNGSSAAYTFPANRGFDGEVLTTNGMGGTYWQTPYTGLTNFTESNFTYDSKTGVKFTPNNAATNVDVVLQPKGTGAILAQQPDGFSTGGNNRGNQSVDLQTNRVLPTQVASGLYSFIGGGSNNTASGNGSVVAGGGYVGSFFNQDRGNKASGEFSSIGGGYNNITSGDYSAIPGGHTNIASGRGAFAGGFITNASGDYSISIGYSNSASGENSIAVGSVNTASGVNSNAFGNGNTAQSYAETVIGTFATVGSGSSNSYISTDRLFVVGNGTTLASSNALTILKNANTTIGGSLTINGNGTNTSYLFPTTRGTSGQMLQTDGNGGTSWNTPYTGLTNFTESNFTYDSKTGVKFTPNNSENTVDLVLSPKGTGSILAQQPDGNWTGGENRGRNSVDLQLSRNGGSQVASGSFSVISGGYSNCANGLYSAVSGGAYNTASGKFSFVGGGYYNTAQSYGESVLGVYATVGSGDATSFVSTDRLFAIGNGSYFARSNALTILKNANTTIGGSLTINGNGTNTSYSFPTTRGTSGQVLSTNADGTSNWTSPNTGLTNFTESNYTYDTGTGVKFTPNNAASDVDIVVQPKGSGSIIAQQPTGTSQGGNLRGNKAVDLQLIRTNASFVASGTASAILGGRNNTASGFGSIAMGDYTTSSGVFSTSIGSLTTASGGYSTATGYSTVASGDYSTAIGYSSIASGDYSLCMGYYTTAPSGYETVIGNSNTTYTPSSTTGWNATDRLFVVGNGTSGANKSNALTILKNGNTTFSGDLSAKSLSLNYTSQTNVTNLTNVTESIISLNNNQTVTNLPTGNDGKIIYIINIGSGDITLPSSLGTITAGKVASFVAIGSSWYRLN